MKSQHIKFSVVTAGLVLFIAIATFPQSPVSPELGWNVVPTTDGGSVLLGPEAGPVWVETASDILSSAANSCPEFKVVLQDISYSICIHKGFPPGRVTFVSTADPGFSTPDKVALGDPVDHLINERSLAMSEETGFSCFVCLPSGWAAAFPALDENLQWIPCEQHLADGSVVSWLFKRESTCTTTFHNQ